MADTSTAAALARHLEFGDLLSDPVHLEFEDGSGGGRMLFGLRELALRDHGRKNEESTVWLHPESNSHVFVDTERDEVVVRVPTHSSSTGETSADKTHTSSASNIVSGLFRLGLASKASEAVGAPPAEWRIKIPKKQSTLIAADALSAAASGIDVGVFSHGKSEHDASDSSIRICILSTAASVAQAVVGSFPQLDRNGILKDSEHGVPVSRLATHVFLTSGRPLSLAFTAVHATPSMTAADSGRKRRGPSAADHAFGWGDGAMLTAHDYRCYVFAFSPDISCSALEKDFKLAKKAVKRAWALSHKAHGSDSSKKSPIWLLLCAAPAARFTAKARGLPFVSKEDAERVAENLDKKRGFFKAGGGVVGEHDAAGGRYLEIDAVGRSKIELRFSTLAKIAAVAAGTPDVSDKIPEQNTATSAAATASAVLTKIGLSSDPARGTPQPVVDSYPAAFLLELRSAIEQPLVDSLHNFSLPTFSEELDLGVRVSFLLSGLSLGHVHVRDHLLAHLSADTGVDIGTSSNFSSYSQVLLFDSDNLFFNDASSFKWSYERVKTESVKTSAKIAAAGVIFGTSVPDLKDSGNGDFSVSETKVRFAVGVTFPPIPEPSMFHRHPKPPAPQLEIISVSLEIRSLNLEMHATTANLAVKSLQKSLRSQVETTLTASIEKVLESSGKKALANILHRHQLDLCAV